MAVELDCVIPLPQAAKRMGMTVEALTRLVTSGKLKAMKTSSGEVVVPESETKNAITRGDKKYGALHGKPITMAKASEQYGPSIQSIWNWVKRGYIATIEDNKEPYPIKIDEADVAYCADVYKTRGKSSRIFDEAGRPYVLKHPDLAEYRRRKKSQANKSPETGIGRKNGRSHK